MNEISPCKGCTERNPGCHGSCDRYKEWKERYDAQQEHLKANRYRMLIPMTDARESAYRTHQKFGAGGRKYGKGGME